MSFSVNNVGNNTCPANLKFGNNAQADNSPSLFGTVVKGVGVAGLGVAAGAGSAYMSAIPDGKTLVEMHNTAMDNRIATLEAFCKESFADKTKTTIDITAEQAKIFGLGDAEIKNVTKEVLEDKILTKQAEAVVYRTQPLGVIQLAVDNPKLGTRAMAIVDDLKKSDIDNLSDVVSTAAEGISKNGGKYVIPEGLPKNIGEPICESLSHAYTTARKSLITRYGFFCGIFAVPTFFLINKIFPRKSQAPRAAK